MTAGPEPSAGTRPASRRPWQQLSTSWQSGPLAVRGFRLLVGGSLASTMGDFCYAVALPWLVLSTHGGTVLLGVVLACYGVPRTVVIPLAGMLTDKIGARTVMLIADVSRCILVGIMALLATRHTVSLETLGPLAALIGAGEGLFIPASYTILPSLLEPRQYASGNAISLAAIQGGTLVGPALGGALVAFVGSAPAFAVDAGTFAVSALTLALIPRRRQAAAANPGSGGTTGAAKANGTSPGIKLTVPYLLRRSRAMQVFVLVTIVANLTGGGLAGVALPALSHAHFGAGGYGALLVALAVGGLLGTLLAARSGNLRKPAVFAALTFVVYAIAMSVLPYLGGEAGAAVAMFFFGACSGLGNAIFFTAGQRWTPPYVLGRIMGLMMLCTYGSYPASVALTGILVHHIGPTLFFPIAGAVTGVAFLGGLTQKEYRDFGSVQPDGTYLLAGLKDRSTVMTDPAVAATAAAAASATE